MPNTKLEKEFSVFQNNGKEDAFANPQRRVCGQGRQSAGGGYRQRRLVNLRRTAAFWQFTRAPASPLLPSDFEYKPIKVTSDSAGRIFVASRGFNRGLLELDRQGQFVQMLGASKVTYSLNDMIWRLFSTKAQRDRMQAFVPAEYNNVSMDQEDFIFVTTGTYDESNLKEMTPVRKINAKGDDVLRRVGDPVADNYFTDIGTINGPSLVVDVVNMDHGLYATLTRSGAGSSLITWTA